MIKKINITESDRRSILSMYNLLVEADKVTVTIQGKVTSNKTDHVYNVKVSLLNSNEEIVGQSATDFDGNFKITAEVDKGNYVLKYTNSLYGMEYSENITITKSETKTVYPYIKPAQQLQDVTVVGTIPIKGKVVTKINNQIVGLSNYDVILYQTGDDGLTYKLESVKTTKDGSFTFLNVPEGEEGVVVKVFGGTDYIDKKVTVTKKKMGDIYLEPKPPVPVPVEPVPIVDVPIEREDIGFEDIDFDVAIKKSFTKNKPIFLLFGTDTNEDTNTVLSKLESDQETINKINNNFIPLYYIVDRYKTSKYVAAAGPLGVTSYPTIAIVKGTNDPTIKDPISKQRVNTIKDSIEIIAVEDRIMDNLDSINDLID